ncbi:twin-arginine translocation signal domain-containing protein [Candidatus Woesearchaeota archaeon]|nr:twin-arginine translocation signal domain-containing protein [Candidatus Woesearchaeota archaeon]
MPIKFTRREFLKLSAVAAAAGLLVGGSGCACPPMPPIGEARTYDQLLDPVQFNDGTYWSQATLEDLIEEFNEVQEIASTLSSLVVQEGESRGTTISFNSLSVDKRKEILKKLSVPWQSQVK